MNGPGFYFNDSGSLSYSPNTLTGPYGRFELHIELHDTYTYPVEGWYYFEDEGIAREFFGLPPLPLDWTADTAFAVGDKVRTENGQLFLVVTAGTTGENGPAHNAQLYPDGTVQFAYIGNFNG